jgi:hypothetical protein
MSSHPSWFGDSATSQRGRQRNSSWESRQRNVGTLYFVGWFLAAGTTVITIALFIWAASNRWGFSKRPWPLAVSLGIGAAGSFALWIHASGDATKGNLVWSGLTGVGWMLLARIGILDADSIEKRARARREGLLPSARITSFVVDSLPRSLWTSGNLYFDKLHFCVGRHPTAVERRVRTAEWRGGRLANGRKAIDFDHDDPPMASG